MSTLRREMLTLDRTPLFTAFTLPDGRKAGLCPEHARHCVHGHPLSSNMSTGGDGIVRCDYKAPPAGKACNARLYVALLSFGGSAVIRGTGERVWLVVEVDDPRAKKLGTTPMMFVEKLIELSATLPGVREDVEKEKLRERFK